MTTRTLNHFILGFYGVIWVYVGHSISFLCFRSVLVAMDNDLVITMVTRSLVTA